MDFIDREREMEFLASKSREEKAQPPLFYTLIPKPDKPEPKSRMMMPNWTGGE
ncbi:MAG: hypothetical protein HY673_07150 [Chloroflexi bacterium]|nr:hypothetical protein [Chloroflexota bacterium]